MRLPTLSALLLLSGTWAQAQTHSSPDVESALRYLELKGPFRAGSAADLPGLEEAIKIYAKDGDLWFRLGQARLAAKQFDPAIKAFEQTLELGGFSLSRLRPTVLYELANAYALKGDKPAAFRFLQQAMDEGFWYLDVLRRDEDLRSLHSDPRWQTLAATKDISKMSRIEGWRYDIWLLGRELQRIHNQPYLKFPKKEQAAYLRQLSRDVPRLTDNQIRVRILGYMARFGAGHTIPDMWSGPELPLGTSIFAEGMFITRSDEKNRPLLGAQILEVGGRPVAEYLATLDANTPKDNPQGLRLWIDFTFRRQWILDGLGLMRNGKSVDLKVRDQAGAIRTVSVEACPPLTGSATVHLQGTDESQLPLYKRKPGLRYWFEPLTDPKTVYVLFRGVGNDPNETLEAFSQRLFGHIETNGVERLIVDIRENTGGNSFLFRSLANSIAGHPKINRRGSLFIIIGPNTFSAGQNFADEIQNRTQALFVGEPTASSPTSRGEATAFTLPYSRMSGYISSIFWQTGWPFDERIWIAPDLPAPATFEAFRARRDPALEVILAYLAKSAAGSGR